MKVKSESHWCYSCESEVHVRLAGDSDVGTGDFSLLLRIVYGCVDRACVIVRISRYGLNVAKTLTRAVEDATLKKNF